MLVGQEKVVESKEEVEVKEEAMGVENEAMWSWQIAEVEEEGVEVMTEVEEVLVVERWWLE